MAITSGMFLNSTSVLLCARHYHFRSIINENKWRWAYPAILGYITRTSLLVILFFILEDFCLIKTYTNSENVLKAQSRSSYTRWKTRTVHPYAQRLTSGLPSDSGVYNTHRTSPFCFFSLHSPSAATLVLLLYSTSTSSSIKNWRDRRWCTKTYSDCYGCKVLKVTLLV